MFRELTLLKITVEPRNSFFHTNQNQPYHPTHSHPTRKHSHPPLNSLLLTKLKGKLVRMLVMFLKSRRITILNTKRDGK
ncbi:hypothetical protein QL285_083463 [Trifolium repens]|nr:hypothetical protein QL285_083463 [Trifolium repens]